MMMKKINLSSVAGMISELNRYQKVGALNDHMLNVIVSEDRILDFHTHEESDEMFYVIEGIMGIETDEGLIEVSAGDFFIVPKGVRHRPVIQTRVKCLLIEKTGTLTKDNTGGTYAEEN